MMIKRVRRSRPKCQRPTLRFSPWAWAKLLYLRDLGPTEVGGFGIATAKDPLLLDDLQLVGQTCTPAYVAFHDEAVADFFDRQVDADLAPQQFARVWVHTHPGDCPLPSATDEETFQRVFGSCDWAVMFILAREGSTYARLRFSAGPGASLLIPIEVDYRRPFAGSDEKAWEAEYAANVQDVEPLRGGSFRAACREADRLLDPFHVEDIEAWEEYDRHRRGFAEDEALLRSICE